MFFFFMHYCTGNVWSCYLTNNGKPWGVDTRLKQIVGRLKASPSLLSLVDIKVNKWACSCSWCIGGVLFQENYLTMYIINIVCLCGTLSVWFRWTHCSVQYFLPACEMHWKLTTAQQQQTNSWNQPLFLDLQCPLVWLATREEILPPTAD